MLIAGGTPPAAAIVEFDHDNVAVRRPTDGVILAANSFRKLGRRQVDDEEDDDSGWLGWLSRYDRLKKAIRKRHGRIDRSMNLIAIEGVPMGCNLHSATLFPKDLVIRVSMGRSPAYKHPFRGFRMTKRGIIAAKP
jgi:hypothetical protein